MAPVGRGAVDAARVHRAVGGRACAAADRHGTARAAARRPASCGEPGGATGQRAHRQRAAGLRNRGLRDRAGSASERRAAGAGRWEQRGLGAGAGFFCRRATVAGRPGLYDTVRRRAGGAGRCGRRRLHPAAVPVDRAERARAGRHPDIARDCRPRAACRRARALHRRTGAGAPHRGRAAGPPGGDGARGTRGVHGRALLARSGRGFGSRSSSTANRRRSGSPRPRRRRRRPHRRLQRPRCHAQRRARAPPRPPALSVRLERAPGDRCARSRDRRSARTPSAAPAAPRGCLRAG